MPTNIGVDCATVLRMCPSLSSHCCNPGDWLDENHIAYDFYRIEKYGAIAREYQSYLQCRLSTSQWCWRPRERDSERCEMEPKLYSEIRSKIDSRPYTKYAKTVQPNRNARRQFALPWRWCGCKICFIFVRSVLSTAAARNRTHKTVKYEKCPSAIREWVNNYVRVLFLFRFSFFLQLVGGDCISLSHRIQADWSAPCVRGRVFHADKFRIRRRPST